MRIHLILVEGVIEITLRVLVQRLIIAPAGFGKLTVPGALGVSYGLGVVILLVVFGASLWFMDKLIKPTKKEVTGTTPVATPKSIY
ncbi:MAG: hypothetical protein KGZ79_13320 [Dethiobacter sp.]|jgi:hypothetical protein|nr:hypothetical protein [Dethiobacter sp.]